MRWFKAKKNTPGAAPQSLAMSKPLPPKAAKAPEFITRAQAYKEQLETAKNFDELSALWKKFSFAYTMQTDDPFSDAYRQEVTELYQKLVDTPYDVQNELTSSHLSDEAFARGFPWTSDNLGVVAHEIGKAVQGFRVIAQHAPHAKSIIEFGAGWGNTAIPMARAGMDVCAVDIDQAFLKRIANEAKALSAPLRTYHADFLEAASNPGQRYDVALFSSSFHHCLEFQDLLTHIRENVLTENGVIAFFAEPISNGFSFPWGLRYDGEAVWAITCNKWLELGFREDFFLDLLKRTELQGEMVPDTTGLMGPAWLARPI